jgi:putative membrane protein
MSERRDASSDGSAARRHKHNPLVAAFVGAAGGIAGAWVMVRVNHLIGPTETNGNRHETRHQASPNDTDGTFSDEPATMQAAESVARTVSGRRLSEPAKRIGGSMVHYAFGAVTGAFYGALSELQPGAAAGAGLPFGAAVWLIADEMGVPLAGFAGPPTEYPIARHASALGSHLAFGLTLEAVRRLLLGRSYDGVLDE